MPDMNDNYHNAIRDHGKTLITHIALVDDTDTELTGGSPAYARKPVAWVDDGVGVMRPDADLLFDIPAGATIGGWRGFSALSNGTDYGGKELTQEVYAGQGEYTLSAASTSITHQSPPA